MVAYGIEAYRSALHEALQPSWLAIADVSDGHAVEGAKDGRALSADGKDVVLLVVTSLFEERTPLERQRMVNDVLAEPLASGLIHSLQLRCWTPAQWQKKGSPKTVASREGNSPKTELQGLSESPVVTLRPAEPMNDTVLELPPCAEEKLLLPRAPLSGSLEERRKQCQAGAGSALFQCDGSCNRSAGGGW